MIFCLVVDEGSISQAARLRYISQPAVTRQIHQLEDHYCTLLFDRTDGKLKVTEAGKVLYPFAKAIVEDFNRSKEAIQHETGNYDVNLRVGATLTIGEYLLPGLLGRFKKQFPEIKLSLKIGNTPSILESLSDDVIDLALVEGVVENKNFNVRKFADDELILVCPADHPWKDRTEVDIEELSYERVIWREAISGTRMIVENALKEYKVLDKIESYMELGSTQSIKSAVEAGLGVSILPRLTVATELKYGVLREVNITGFILTRGLWMVQKPRRFRRMGVDHFVDFIQKD